MSTADFQFWWWVARRIVTEKIGDVYLWTALDQDTKLVASFVVGKRSADIARKLMVDLRNCMVMPNAHQSDAHAHKTGSYLQISTDGFPAYPEAVDLAFGPYAKYGQLIKDYRNTDQPGRYGPPEMVGTERRGIFGINEEEKRTICTSYVERHNLTIRTLMKRFTRLSLGFSKKLQNLEAACAMFLCFYNFVWRTRDAINGRTRLPAAMAAGVSESLMDFEALFDKVMGNAA